MHVISDDQQLELLDQTVLAAVYDLSFDWTNVIKKNLKIRDSFT